MMKSGRPTTILTKAFARAGAAPDGPKPKDLLEAIYEERPDLKGQPVLFPSQGKLGFTVIIGDEVFKGPNSERTAGNFDVESDILQELMGKGLPVPEITCVGKKSIFYGMTRMEGVPLRPLEHSMPPEELQRIAEDVADFMIRMALALPRESGLLATQGDLWETNILIDPETKRLSGIIDFGLAHDVTKADLVPKNIMHPRFRQMVTEALEARKGELPDTPEGMVSAAPPVDVAMEAFMNRPG